MPDTPVGRAFPAFLDAYNSGRLDRIRAFAADHIPADADRLDPNFFARYWMGIYREYGPVALVSIDTTESPPEFWVRGRLTRAWSVFQFLFTEGPSPRLNGWAVGRGERPSGVRDTAAVPPARLADVLHPYLHALELEDHFSGAVAVAKDGELIFERAYGQADRRHGVPNRTDTRHVIASATKMLTAVAILQLVERGALALSDPLGKHVPEYPDRIGSAVTLRHLLTHTSGIELDNHAPYNRDARAARSVEELLQAQLRHIDNLNQGPLSSFEPSNGFDYTNEGFDLLGVIIARASGRTWQGYVRERILEHAGMKRTGFHRDVPVADLSTGYSLGSDHPEALRRENRSLIPPYARPSGGMYSTAGDLIRFLRALKEGRLLSHSLQAATTPQVDWRGAAPVRSSYGHGFEITEVGGVRYYGHSGSQPGIDARVRAYPELGYAVVVLSNYDNAARNVADHIHDLITGQR